MNRKPGFGLIGAGLAFLTLGAALGGQHDGFYAFIPLGVVFIALGAGRRKGDSSVSG